MLLAQYLKIMVVALKSSFALVVIGASHYLYRRTHHPFCGFLGKSSRPFVICKSAILSRKAALQQNGYLLVLVISIVLSFRHNKVGVVPVSSFWHNAHAFIAY